MSSVNWRFFPSSITYKQQKSAGRHLTCMSRRVMKPLLSMSHIWKNCWVFSRIVFCPTSPFSYFLSSSLLACLGHAVGATTPVLLLEMAQGAVKAAIIFFFFLFFLSLLMCDGLPYPSHEPGAERRGAAEKDPGEVELQAVVHQSLSPMSQIAIS